MLDATMGIIYAIGQLIIQAIDSSFALLLLVLFIALAYVIGGWIVNGLKKTLR
jgi:hypothetical protein